MNKTTIALTLASLLGACDLTVPVVSSSGGSTSVGVDGGASSFPFQEVMDQGLGAYIGSPALEETSVTTDLLFPNIDVHHFSSDNRGPVCMRGDEFFVETREGSSDTLMIFLQGGGVCLDEVCAATPKPMLTLRLFAASSIVGIGGLVNPSSDRNPAKDFDVVNVPYCDGSLFMGDVDRRLDDGVDVLDLTPDDQAYQRGVQNLVAAFQTAKRTFPNPSRVVLAGSSGGAYGILLGTALARYFYPDQDVHVISDSGAPIVNGVDTDFIVRAVTQIDAMRLVPRSCPECLTNGHATGIIEWAMERDPRIKVAYMTHARDHVIGEFFMGTTADEFQAATISESARMMSRFPGRAFRFIVPGSRHTLAMDVDTAPAFLQQTALILFGPLFLEGPAVSSSTLSSWVLGGMRETGRDASGATYTGHDWVRTFLNDTANTPDVVQLQ